MVVHVVMCKFKEELSDADKRIALFNIKNGIEGLNDKINGLKSVRVETLLMPTSDMDFMVVAKFDGESALFGYNDSPIYQPVKNYIVKMIESYHRVDYHE